MKRLMHLLIDNTVTEEVASRCMEGVEINSLSEDLQNRVAELLTSGTDEDLGDIVKIALDHSVQAIEDGVVPNVIIAIGHESADELNDLLTEVGIGMTRVNKDFPMDGSMDSDEPVEEIESE